MPATRLSRVFTFIAPLVRVDRLADGAVRDWAFAFAAARLVTLAGVFCALPFALAAAPHILVDALGLFVALVVGSAAALLALRHRSPGEAVAAGALSLGLMALGPWPEFGGALVACAALVAGLLDLAAMPAGRRDKLVGTCGLAVAALGLLGYALWNTLDIGEGGWLYALPALAVAPVATMVFNLALSRRRLSGLIETRADAAMREETMLAAADAAVMIADRSGQIVDCTTSSMTLFACQQDDLAGRGLFERALIADRPALILAISDASTRGVRSDLIVRLRLGGYGEGEAPRFARFSVAVTPSQARAALCFRRLGEESVADNPGFDADLMRILAHELRTPMNAVIGFSQLLADSGGRAANQSQTADQARMILRAAREAHAASLAALDLMRVESADFALSPEPVDLAELAQAAASGVGAAVANLSAPPLVETDPAAVRMMFGALARSLSAAFDGRAHVSCEIGRAGALPFVRFTARDTAPVVILGGAGQSSQFGVASALAIRLAARLGVRLALELDGAQPTATFEFPHAPPVAAQTRVSSPVSYLKSA